MLRAGTSQPLALCFIKERCKILQPALGTQKEQTLLYFLLKYRYISFHWVPEGKEGGVFVKSVLILSSLGHFILLCTPRQEGQAIWRISTHQCYRHLFRVQSQPLPSEAPAWEHMAAAAPRAAQHLLSHHNSTSQPHRALPTKIRG